MNFSIHHNANEVVNTDIFQKKRTETKEWRGRTIVQYLVNASVITNWFVLSRAPIYEMALCIAELVHNKIWVPDIHILEKNIQGISEKFLFQLKTLSSIDYVRLMKHLAICNNDEKELINKLQRDFFLTSMDISEILQGAHVWLDDEGKTYDEWIEKMESKEERISSHPSSDAQFSVRGPFVKELLFSKITDQNGKIYRWFQLENNPFQYGYFLRYIRDYFLYKLFGRNQGPYGSSVFRDSKPLILYSHNSFTSIDFSLLDSG